MELVSLRYISLLNLEGVVRVLLAFVSHFDSPASGQQTGVTGVVVPPPL